MQHHRSYIEEAIASSGRLLGPQRSYTALAAYCPGCLSKMVFYRQCLTDLFGFSTNSTMRLFYTVLRLCANSCISRNKGLYKYRFNISKTFPQTLDFADFCFSPRFVDDRLCCQLGLTACLAVASLLHRVSASVYNTSVVTYSIARVVYTIFDRPLWSGVTGIVAHAETKRLLALKRSLWRERNAGAWWFMAGPWWNVGLFLHSVVQRSQPLRARLDTFRYAQVGVCRPYDHEKVARAHPTSVAEKMHTEVEYSADDW